MTEVIFKDYEEALDKLKELGVVAKTKDTSALMLLVYKDVDDDGRLVEYDCEVVGYKWKENPKECLNDTYTNLMIKADDRLFGINVDYFKDMQKKGWSKVAS